MTRFSKNLIENLLAVIGALLVITAVITEIQEIKTTAANNKLLDRAYNALTRESSAIAGILPMGDGEHRKSILVLIKDRKDYVMFSLVYSGLLYSSWECFPDNRDNRQEAIAVLRKYLEQRPN